MKPGLKEKIKEEFERKYNQQLSELENSVSAFEDQVVIMNSWENIEKELEEHTFPQFEKWYEKINLLRSPIASIKSFKKETKRLRRMRYGFRNDPSVILMRIKIFFGKKNRRKLFLLFFSIILIILLLVLIIR